MKKHIYKFLFFVAIAGTFSSCNVEEFNDLNNPVTAGFEESLTRGDLQDLVGGVFYSSRLRLGTYYDDCGVVGREFWRFSSSDPRFTSDLLGGENSVLDNNTFYITGPWASRYRTVKNANLILGFLENPEVGAIFSAQEVSATKGFLKTFIAHELLLNLNLTDENGIRVDISDETNLGPIVSKSEALSAIRALLAEAVSDLSGGGNAFPFAAPAGYSFTTPSSFSQVANAYAARVAIYQGDASGALGHLNNSFYDLNGDLSTGYYYTFSADQTDILNPMFFPVNATTAGARVMEPSFLADAEANDGRLSKVALRDESITLDGLTGDYSVNLYETNVAPIATIRNEELILIFAEANITANPTAAANALSVVRQAAGLPAYTGGTDPASLTAEMLRQRRYSLYAEGHRWIDMRRYNLLNTLPLARPNDDIWSNFPIPLTEVGI